MKKYILLIIMALALVGCSKHDNGIILFYSKQCPHCEQVEAFIQANNVRSKLKFTEKEVSQNEQNVMALVKVMKKCGLPVKGQVEVPLLWTGSKCLIGAPDISKFFKEKMQ